MMISNELAAAINKEIGLELFAANQYSATAAYLDGIPLKKLAAMFYKQANEEREHADKFMHYLADTGATLEIPAIDKPKFEFKSVEEAVKVALDWELEVTRRINELMDIAVAKKDYLAQGFLQWFVNEQLEEVTTMENLLKLVKAAGERNLFMIEGYLAHQE
jgi:ferritin